MKLSKYRSVMLGLLIILLVQIMIFNKVSELVSMFGG